MNYCDSEPIPDSGSPVSLVEVAGADADNPTAREINQRGGLPLMVGDSILAEVSCAELTAGLAAAGELSDAELSRICGELAMRLQDTLNAGEPSADLIETASDAAALFVLCLQQHGITDRSQIGPCSLQFDPANCRLELAQTA